MMSFGQPSFSRQTQCIVNVDTLPDKIQLKTSHVRRYSCQGTKSEEGIGENNKLPPLNTKFGKDDPCSMPGGVLMAFDSLLLIYDTPLIITIKYI